MNFRLHLEDLRKSLSIKEDKKGLKHVINKKSPILPFPTRNPERAKFSNGFSGVVGEFARIICHNSLDKQVDMEAVIEDITNRVKPAEEDKSHFVRLIRMFLTEDLNTLKVFHPHIFQYIPTTSGSEAKGEKNIAVFIRDVLSGDSNILKEFFAKNDANHLVAKLILNHLNHLVATEENTRYYGMIPVITKVFQEDLVFLEKHQDYLIENIYLFLAYYYFFYTTQLTIKLNQFNKADWNEVSEMIYTLDWEGTSKSRIGYERGYQRVKDAAKYLLVHVNCLEHLNILFGTERPLSYGQLNDTFEALTEDEKTELTNVLKTWVVEYRYHASLTELDYVAETYDDLVTQLYQSLEEGLALETRSRYALSIEEVGKKYFLKTRGILGYMYNISQDFILLLTAISVKDNRKSLKEVFKEFERRGVFLDRHSKEAVVQLFDKLNILDKKSDSGDAQYVKPIL